MIELDINKETSFTLEMRIDGDVSGSKPPSMKFSILGENFVISLPAKRVDNGVYEVSCPKLNGILATGDYDVNVEVFIDDKHFVPLTETIRLKEEVRPTVKISESKEVKAPEIKVSMSSTPAKTSSFKKTDEIVTVN